MATINPTWLASFGSECWYCGKTLTPETVTVDHRTPRCRGGKNNTVNLVPACRRCNCTKKHRTEAEFFSYKPVFQQRRRFAPLKGTPTPSNRCTITTALIHRGKADANSRCRYCRGTGNRKSWFSPWRCVPCTCYRRQFRAGNSYSADGTSEIRPTGLSQVGSGVLGRTAYLIREAAFRKAAEYALLVQRSGDEAAYITALQVAVWIRSFLEATA